LSGVEYACPSGPFAIEELIHCSPHFIWRLP
jgi:hypothetical protein